MPHPPLAVDQALLPGNTRDGEPSNGAASTGCCRKRWQGLPVGPLVAALVVGGIALLGVSGGALVEQGVFARHKSSACAAADSTAECGAHGHCELTDGGEASCFCAGGWYGNNCPRYMGKTRRPLGTDGNCHCPSPTGCDTDPCKNGATCTAKEGGCTPSAHTCYTCVCVRGWSGDDCSHATGCDSNPCKNGATCTASGGDHTCACERGWNGADCSHAVGCDTDPCKNGGTCIATGGDHHYYLGIDHTCICTSDWTGTSCSQPAKFIAPCTSSNDYGWPHFNSPAELESSPWKSYFEAVYGEVPSKYPVCIYDFWCGLFSPSLSPPPLSVSALLGFQAHSVVRYWRCGRTPGT
eukprot:COSAG01_NODE_1108_length_11662_cov_189.275534_1_plen_353_part_00